MRDRRGHVRIPTDTSALTAWDSAAVIWLTWAVVGDVCVVLVRPFARPDISLLGLVLVVWAAAALVALAVILVTRLTLGFAGRSSLAIGAAIAMGTTLSLTLTAVVFPIAALMGLASTALLLPVAGWLWKRLPRLGLKRSTGIIRIRALVIVSAASPLVTAALLLVTSGPDDVVLAVWPALAGSMTALTLLAIRRIVDA